MRTAITLTKTHAGKWALVASPDVPLLEQKNSFREFRASKAHKEFAEVVYQESDGHRETIRLITPKELSKIEIQAAQDQAESERFDKEAAKRKSHDPKREKIEAEFKAREKEAEAASGKTAPEPIETKSTETQ